MGSAFFRKRLTVGAIQHAWTISLGRRTGLERLGHLRCEVQARLSAARLTDGRSCPMPITQTDPADALGQTPAPINRMRQELREGGLLTLRGRQLTTRAASSPV